MNDKMIYNAFDRMQPSYADLTDRIMRQIKTNKKHAPVRYRVLKTSVCILLAACFLLLSVSGYAAVKLISVKLPEPGEGKGIRYTVYNNAGVVKLSDEVMSDLKQYNGRSDKNKYKAAAGHEFGRHFKDYFEVDEYLGISILKNSLFGEAPDNVLTKDIILRSTGDENMLNGLIISGSHTVSGASAGCHISIIIKLTDDKNPLSEIDMPESGNTTLYVNENGDLVSDINIQSGYKKTSKVSSYKSMQNGLEAEIVVSTESLKLKPEENIEVPYILNSINAYFIHDNIIYSLMFRLPVFENYKSENFTSTAPEPDPLTTDDYIILTQYVIDAFIVN
ncbi:MAG: hypothetical protein ACYCWE_05140 [Eubacteriales bacterium]